MSNKLKRIITILMVIVAITSITGIFNDSDKKASPEYKALLKEAGIDHYKSFFGMETVSYALKNADGEIGIYDIGYKDNTVININITAYHEYYSSDELERELFENNIKDEIELEDVASANFCKVEYRSEGNYFIVSMEATELNKEENYSQLFWMGMTERLAPLSLSELCGNLELNENIIKR